MHDRRADDRRDISAATWRAALDRVLADGGQPQLVFQPIVDLAQGTVAGYEALSRFPGPPSAPPDEWIRAAARAGLGPALEARIVRAALERLDDLPPDCFLSVNVSPELLATPELAAALAEHGRFDRVVVELTEHAPLDAVPPALDLIRRGGGHIAIDDAGAGHSGLSRLLSIRPSMVKLDRALISDIDRDPAKRALVEMIGTFTGRIDAWVLAEGVERIGELEELIRLGVPLAQGYLLGRPSPEWITELPATLADVIERLVGAAGRAGSLAPLVERAPTVREEAGLPPAAFLADPGLEAVVVLDGHGRPVALQTREAAAAGCRPNRRILLVHPEEFLGDTAKRAMTRDRAERFDPLLCVDGRGRYVGVVAVDRLMLAVAG